MESQFITLNKENISKEHICCAFSDKKCKAGYELKKQWLTKELENGYIFRRLDERAKVFMEYVPAEMAWCPVDAPNFLLIGCFWVSGQYKGKGYAKKLLEIALTDARQQGKDGLVTVAGNVKFHFMSDTKWLLRQGFEIVEKLPNGFSLLVKRINPEARNPQFKDTVLTGECPDKEGVVVYYSNRCPFTEYYIHEILKATVKAKQIPLKIIKLESCEQAQTSPTPATIFSLFYNGKFVSTDVSICMASRFEKAIKVD